MRYPIQTVRHALPHPNALLAMPFRHSPFHAPFLQTPPSIHSRTLPRNEINRTRGGMRRRGREGIGKENEPDVGTISPHHAKDGSGVVKRAKGRGRGAQRGEGRAADTPPHALSTCSTQHQSHVIILLGPSTVDFLY